jgi:hypothetical protein
MPTKPISSEYGNRDDIFGAVDDAENKKLGYTEKDIKDWLIANKTPLGIDTGKSYQLEDQIKYFSGSDPEYKNRVASLGQARAQGNIDQATYDDLRKQLAEGEYAPKADLTEFDNLLTKLESSKMRQQRQKSVEGRRDTYQKALASMMNNF